jgi:hypothetical protein
MLPQFPGVARLYLERLMAERDVAGSEAVWQWMRGQGLGEGAIEGEYRKFAAGRQGPGR